MKQKLADLAVKYLMPEIRKARGIPEPNTIKDYVAWTAETITDGDWTPDAVSYLREWFDDYIGDHDE
jgi:hypothetical protein